MVLPIEQTESPGEFIKTQIPGWVQWSMPVIPVTQEV
jgi:hypothetical protein